MNHKLILSNHIISNSSPYKSFTIWKRVYRYQSPSNAYFESSHPNHSICQFILHIIIIQPNEHLTGINLINLEGRKLTYSVYLKEFGDESANSMLWGTLFKTSIFKGLIDILKTPLEKCWLELYFETSSISYVLCKPFGAGSSADCNYVSSLPRRPRSGFLKKSRLSFYCQIATINALISLRKHMSGWYLVADMRANFTLTHSKQIQNFKCGWYPHVQITSL